MSTGPAIVANGVVGEISGAVEDTMAVAIGEGGPPFGVRVAYGSGGAWVHATG